MMSQVTFYKDLGFDRAHANVRDFATPAARDAWFASHAESPFPQVCNYNKVQNSFDLEMQYDDAIRYGYCKVSYLDGTGNPTGFSDYCFIDSVQLINDRVCRFELTVDPWQTYMFKPDGTPGFTLERSFVVRAHVDRWSPDSNYPAMQVYPNETIDGFAVVEGQTPISSYNSGGPITEPGKFAVIAASITQTTGDIRYIYFPVLLVNNDDAEVIDGGYPTLAQILSGAVWDLMSVDPNSVLSMSLIPGLDGLIFTYVSSGHWGVSLGGNLNATSFGTVQAIEKTTALYATLDDLPTPFMYGLSISNAFKPHTSPGGTWDDVEESERFEPAMYMSPVVERYICAPDGSVVMRIQDDVVIRQPGNVSGTAELRLWVPAEASVPSMVGTVDVEPSGPIGWTGTRGTPNMAVAVAMGRAVTIQGLPVELASDSWLTYMVTERDTTRQLDALNKERTVVGGATGIIGDLLSGNIGGALSGAFTTGYNALNIDRERSMNEQGIKNQTSRLLIAGSGSGMRFLLSYIPWYVVKRADEATRKAFFDKIRYEGYNVRRYMTPDLRSRRVFNHILTINAVIRGDMPEDIRSQLQSIFDGGVTIWHDSYDYDSNIANVERSLTG